MFKTFEFHLLVMYGISKVVITGHSFSFEIVKVMVYIDMFCDGRISFNSYFAIVRMTNAESDICPL